MDIQNKKLADSEFHALRAEVLLQWPTGRDVDLDEAVARVKAITVAEHSKVTFSAEELVESYKEEA